MESYISRQGYDLADIGRNFVKWYQHGFWSSLSYAFDVGRATSSAMYKILQGSLANGEEKSQGNGSIMRSDYFMGNIFSSRPEIDFQKWRLAKACPLPDFR